MELLPFKEFRTIYMHQIGWFSERGDNFLNLVQKEGEGTQKGEGGLVPLEKFQFMLLLFCKLSTNNSSHDHTNFL